MTWDELEKRLPNGFHDARLDEITISYRQKKAVFELEFWAVRAWPDQTPAVVPELYRRGRLTFLKVIACAVDVPNGEYQESGACELWVDMAPLTDALPSHPSWPREPLPEGAFLRSFYFLNDAASYVHLAAHSVEFEWVSETRLLSLS